MYTHRFLKTNLHHDTDSFDFKEKHRVLPIFRRKTKHIEAHSSFSLEKIYNNTS